MSRKPPLPSPLVADAANIHSSVESELSQTYTHVRLSLQEIEALINRQLPNGFTIYETSTLQLGMAQSLLPYTVAVEVNKPADLQLAGEGSNLFLYLPLQVKVTLKDKGLLLSLMPLEAVMQVEVKARIQMHLKSDWQLFTRTEIEQFNWLLSPEIRILGVPVGALGIIEKELERFIGMWIGKIDEVIAEQISFREIALSVWEVLQESFHIWDEPDVWLRCYPQKAFISGIQIAGNDKQLEMLLCVNGRVETNTDTPVSLGNANSFPLPDALPLKEKDATQHLSVVKIVNHLSYNKISEVINQHLSQYTYRFFSNLYYLRFGRVKLYAVPERNLVLAEAFFTGSMRGRAYLRFTPYFNIQEKTLSLRNFEFELRTPSLLLHLANRLAGQTLADKLCDTIQELVNEQLGELNQFLRDFLSSQQVENVLFNSAISEVAIESLLFDTDAIKAVLAIKGISVATVMLEGYY